MKQITNDSMAVEFCISAAQARLSAKSATTYRYVSVEYGRTCYGATAPVTRDNDLVGNKGCTLAWMGNSTESCGGRAMYNLYVSTDVSTSSASSPISTTGTGTVPLATFTG